MPGDYFFDAAILFAAGFILIIQSRLGKHMAGQQQAVDAVAAQLQKVRFEVVGVRDVLLARIDELQSQLEDGVEVVDLTALKLAAQSLDDIVPDPVVEVEVPVEVPAEVPVDVPEAPVE